MRRARAHSGERREARRCGRSGAGSGRAQFNTGGAGRRERDSRGNDSWHSLNFQLFEAKFDFCPTTVTNQEQPNGAATPALRKFPAEELRKGQHLLPVSDRPARVGGSQSLRSFGRGVGAQREPCPCSQSVGAPLLAHMAWVCLDTGSIGSVDPRYSHLPLLLR